MRPMRAPRDKWKAFEDYYRETDPMKAAADIFGSSTLPLIIIVKSQTKSSHFLAKSNFFNDFLTQNLYKQDGKRGDMPQNKDQHVIGIG